MGGGRPVEVLLSGLDSQPLLAPKTVDLEEPIANREVNIALWPRQIRCSQKHREPGLQFFPSDPANRVLIGEEGL